jgi:hypothetical protein
VALVPIPDLGQGLNLDGQPEELALGVSSGTSSNMRYRNGTAERFRGMANVYTTPLVAPYHICHYTVGTTRYVVYAGLQKTYVDDGQPAGAGLVDITNGNNAGAIDDRFCGFVFNGVYVQNNGIDVPQYWGGTGTLAALPAWPAGYKAGWMRAFGNKIVAGDITRAGVRERGTVLWSHTADPATLPTSWDIADPTKDAGDFPLAETNGTLIDALPMGDMNVIYKDDAIHFQQNISNNQIFRFGRLPGDSGLLARGCVAAYPGGHVYLTTGFDVVTHSGQGLHSILEGRMRTWLKANINSTYAQRSFLVKNVAANEILICFPSGAAVACDKAIVWNWTDDKFAIRDLNNVTYGSLGQVSLLDTDTWAGAVGTWADETEAWGFSDYALNTPRVIFSRATPGLAMFDASSKDYGVEFTAMLELRGLHFDAPDRMKLCRGVRPKIDAPNGASVGVQVGAAMVPDGTITWQPSTTFTVGTDIQADCFASGRFLALRFFTTLDVPWRIRSCQVDIQPQGGY